MEHLWCLKNKKPKINYDLKGLVRFASKVQWTVERILANNAYHREDCSPIMQILLQASHRPALHHKKLIETLDKSEAYT